MKQKLFVYGTLQDPQVQKNVIGIIVNGKRDVLHGYIISTITMTDAVYPIIVPHPTNIIDGLILTVTPEELKRIDLYETEAFKREKVTLGSGKSAWVYKK